MKLKDLIKKYGDYDVVVSRRIATNEIVIEGREPESKTVFDLKDDDIYFNISNAGEICRCKVNLLSAYQDRLEIGNVCLTQKDAEKEIQRRKVETLLLKHGGRRWFKKDGDNWFMYLDEYNLVSRSCSKAPCQGMIYFDTHGEAVEVCEKIGTSRIKDALFEVR